MIDEKEVDGKSGKQYLVTAELDLFLFVKANQATVGSFSARGKGLSKKDHKDAKIKAYQKLKVSKKKLAGMLAEADDALMQVLKDQSGKNFPYIFCL